MTRTAPLRVDVCFKLATWSIKWLSDWPLGWSMIVSEETWWLKHNTRKNFLHIWTSARRASLDAICNWRQVKFCLYESDSTGACLQGDWRLRCGNLEKKKRKGKAGCCHLDKDKRTGFVHTATMWLPSSLRGFTSRPPLELQTSCMTRFVCNLQINKETNSPSISIYSTFIWLFLCCSRWSEVHKAQQLRRMMVGVCGSQRRSTRQTFIHFRLM